MRKTLLLLVILMISMVSFSQATLISIKEKRFKTTEKVKIQGAVGYLEVPENRTNPTSRKITCKYVHLKSTAASPATPVVFLEGGDGYSTWQAESPRDLTDWLEILAVSDLIFLDRRGTNDESLTYVWPEALPSDFLVSEMVANEHYQRMAAAALPHFKEKGIDISGYNIEEHAHDVNDLMTALGIDRYNLWGFSYGSHISMTTMQLFPERIERAILIGADALNQALNYPSHLEEHVKKLSAMVAQDPVINPTVPDFAGLLDSVMQQLAERPATVTFPHPLTGEKMDVNVGPFGLALILRLDIDDSNDIPVLPRLLYSIQQGDYKMLTWFVQRRIVFGLGVPGSGIHQQLASGASTERWEEIQAQAASSPFGNVVNFPFGAVKDTWPTPPLSFDPATPMTSDIPTLFVTGTLDARTPVVQVEETKQGFSQAHHILVENAGHEQAMWNVEVFDEAIPAFLLGQEVRKTSAQYAEIEFIPVMGTAQGHPSLR